MYKRFRASFREMLAAANFYTESLCPPGSSLNSSKADRRPFCWPPAHLKEKPPGPNIRFPLRGLAHTARPCHPIHCAGEITETAATRAITGVLGSPLSLGSTRTTCPATGACMPIWRASSSIRAGSCSDASSSFN